MLNNSSEQEQEQEDEQQKQTAAVEAVVAVAIWAADKRASGVGERARRTEPSARMHAAKSDAA